MSCQRKLLVAVEDEPYSRTPSGKSCVLKLAAWLDLAHALKNVVDLEICPISDLEGRCPAIIEAFSTRSSLLISDTFPTADEHILVERFSGYWPIVKKSGIPTIPVIEGDPKNFPVFVRGDRGTFHGGGISGREMKPGSN
jgi:hypothetical protein